MSIKNIWNWFLKAMFPAKCLVCRREGMFLCQKHRQFKSAPPSRAVFKYVDEIYATVTYDDLICQKIVEYFKFRGISDIAEIMAMEIISRNKNFFENSILIPIPLHWTRKLWRGFNQSEILAKKIAEKVSSAEVANILKRVEKTEQQARLSREERIKNTENAFIFIPPLAGEARQGMGKFLLKMENIHTPFKLPLLGRKTQQIPAKSPFTVIAREERLWQSPVKNIKQKNIILIDDVVASGATLDSAAKTLKFAGFQNVKAVVFARGGKV